MSEKPNNIPTPADFFGWISQIMAPMVTATAAFATNVPTPSDPLTMWRNYSEKNEEIYSKFLQDIVHTSAFAQTLGRSSSSAARYRSAIKEAARLYLEAADMPTRDDVTRLAAQVVALDAKLDDMNDNLSDSIDVLPKTLLKVTGALEGLTARLESLESLVKHQSETQAQIAEHLSHLDINLGKQSEATLTTLTNQNEAISALFEGLGGLKSQLESQQGSVGAAGTDAGLNARLEAWQQELSSGLVERLAHLETQLASLKELSEQPSGILVSKLEKLETQLAKLESKMSSAATHESALANQAVENNAKPVARSSRAKKASVSQPTSEA
jgi:polyhydroxyalkanoic acid synthase PhaR subunit